MQGFYDTTPGLFTKCRSEIQGSFPMDDERDQWESFWKFYHLYRQNEETPASRAVLHPNNVKWLKEKVEQELTRQFGRPVKTNFDNDVVHTVCDTLENGISYWYQPYARDFFNNAILNQLIRRFSAGIRERARWVDLHIGWEKHRPQENLPMIHERTTRGEVVIDAAQRGLTDPMQHWENEYLFETRRHRRYPCQAIAGGLTPLQRLPLAPFQ